MPFARTSFLSKISSRCLLVHRIIHCKAHKMRWIVAGGYLLRSFFLSSIVNKDSHFARLLASSVWKTICRCNVCPQTHWLFFCVFLETTPFNVSSRASEVVGSANRLGLSLWHFRFILASSSKSLSSECQSSIPGGNFSFILFLVPADGRYWSSNSLCQP